MAFQGSDNQFARSKEDQESENHIVGLIILTVATVGVLANFFVVFFISFRPSMQNAFGKLTMSQGASDLIASLVYMLYYAPMVFFDIKLFKSDEVTKYFFYIIMVCYETGNLIHFFASINRAIAIFYPLVYVRRFGVNTAYLLNTIAWTVNIILAYFAYLHTDCNSIFTEKSWRWTLTFDTDFCLFMGLYYDFAKNAFLIVFIIVADLITYRKCRLIRTRVLRDSLTSSIAKERKMNEINFVTQALLQGLIFGAELVSYFVVANYMTTPWWKFVFTQFAFQSIHTFMGLITIAFNKEVRVWFRRTRNGVSSFATSSQLINKSDHQIFTTRRLPPLRGVSRND